MSEGERLLIDAVSELGEETTSDNYARDLYRTLANRRWRHDDVPEDVSLSWARAEEGINHLRRRHGAEPLTLAQTGGEGEPVAGVAAELERKGWTSEPLDTGMHRRQHATEDPPRPPGGDRPA